ncbi:hypothetical protein RP20_CCG020571 [Aedes albopictus]|nr:hypothetical protein RP20_CCG020571 [Aedes albopictus]
MSTTPQTVQVVYHTETHHHGDLLDTVLKPMKQLLSSTLHLMGFEKEHKSRRKRDLDDDDDNRIQMVDDNMLEKSEQSDEDLRTVDFGSGIDGALQRLTHKNLTLKIVYAPFGNEGNRNEIMRSMRRRRRRKRSAESEKRKAHEYQELRREYSKRCKKEAPNEKDCSRYCEKFEQFLKETKHSYKEIKHKLSGLLKDCKGKHGGDLKGDLSDSFPKRKENKLIDLDSDESSGKVMKKDKPIDQATDSTTLNEDQVTTVHTELELTTVTGNYSDASEHDKTNTQNPGKDTKNVSTVPPIEKTSYNPLNADFQEQIEQFAENLVDDTTWKVLNTASTKTPETLATTTVVVTSTDQTSKDPTLDDLIESLNKTASNRTVPQPFDAQRHNPVEDDCVKNLDDLLKKIPEFKTDDDEDLDCNETTTQSPDETLVGQTHISHFKKQNLKYNPDEHRPKTVECIKNIDDLLEAVDMEHGGLKKPKNCKISSSTVAPSKHRSDSSARTEDEEFDPVQTHDEQLDQFASAAELPDFIKPPTPFHEEQFDQSTLPVEVHDFIMGRSRNREQFNHDIPSTIDSPDFRASKYSAQPTVAASGPFLNLCEQLRSQQHAAPIKTLSSNQHHFQAQQYGGLGQTSIPVTGETLKATSQVLVNSAYGGFAPNHFCFYQVPPTYGAMRPVYAGGQNYPAGKSLPLGEGPTPEHLLNDPVIETVIEPRGDFPIGSCSGYSGEGLLNVPLSIQKSSGRSTGDDPDLEGAKLLCSLVVPPSTESPLAGNDSLISQEVLVGGARARGHHRHCPRGKVPCADGIQCVLSSHLCDSRVDCFDGSDESHCSCLSRLSQKRRCDGYVDCPLGEDEMGCFGCDKFSFSCFNSFFEHQASHHSETRCYTLIEKCDGFNNCVNGKDEQDCTMLVRDLRSPLAFTVGHSVGVLHRNHKGKWYPVCHNPLSLAREACEAELGPSERDPVIVQHHGDLPGPFIQPSPRSHHVFQPEFTDTCNGLINYVKCPAPKCGSSKQNEMEHARIKIRGKRNTTEIVQIVGGTKAEASAYPFIVGIFRDGKFHCGGSIFNEHWIVTAAHCCDNFPRHHYELRAGLLRRRSFAPQVQVSTVTHVIIHRGYSAQKMINDISLMHSDRPFQYNRWVRPICLPNRHMTTNDRDWIWGPKPGTMCTAIGWGALREHGGSPDHLMQVTVPILPFCKHRNDRDGLAICAAEPSGGHDACQGDSGGPFACISVTSPHEWYLAGVVSHGEGCARPNEPGVYTRVALFNDWIHRKTSEVLPPASTRMDCPGFQCSVGVSFCIPRQKRCNGKVDCLGGEDELHCSLDQLLAETIKETSTVTVAANSTVASSTTEAATTAVTSKIDFVEETAETSEKSTTVTTASNDETSTIATTIETTSVSTEPKPAKDLDMMSDSTAHNITEVTTVEPTTTQDEDTSTSSTTSEYSTTETSFTNQTKFESSTTYEVTTRQVLEDISASPVFNETTSTLEYNAAMPTDPSTIPTSTLPATIDSIDSYSSTANHSSVDFSITTEPTTETSLHTTESVTELSTSTAETSSIETSTVLDTTTIMETTTPLYSSKIYETTSMTHETESSDTTQSSELATTESTTSTTTPDETTPLVTTESEHSSTTTSPFWMQVNEAISKLKPHFPSMHREMEDRNQQQYDSIRATLSDNATSTTTPIPKTSYDTSTTELATSTTDSTSSTSISPSTVESSSTVPHDQEFSETQIEPVKAETTNATAEQHPFFREIHDLVEEKTRRLNQFRLSMHYLHTSLKNQTLDTNETSYRYKRFVCSKIPQTINIAHHCDRIIDCEDGTDELRCTCRDYLKDKYDFLICDGKTDCLDLTDEDDCFSCATGQYPCRMSKVCIDEKKLCDNVPDCPLHEDELDCLALTDGHKVYFDANNLTEFKYEGLVTKNTNGTWDLICGAEVNNKSVDSIGKICSFLGFAGYKSYYQTILTPLVNETVDLEHQPLLIMSYRNVSSEPNCKALHITCVPFINATEHEISHYENQHKEQPVQVNIRPTNPIKNISSQAYITFNENAHIEFIENFGDDYDWPWNADIYLEGVFLCSAIIIDVNWIVVDSSCMRMINLKNDYLSVVAGGAKSYLKISGPYDQVVRVDCYHFLPEPRVVMLHLAKNLTFTRHVLPTFIPEQNHNIEDNQCLAVGQDKYGRTRTLRVHMNMTNCEPFHVCYQLNPDRGIYHADHCYSENASRTGVVVCKSKISGWYPVGFYQNKHGLCGFNEVVKMISLKEYYTDIQHVLNHEKCNEFPEPLCDGLRCWLGKCIGHSLVCDNKMDCDDNSDERPEACNAINDTSTACLPTQFRCGNHQCVDKSKFCDGRNDCGDLSDEPHECSCYTYLKVTNPSKICDGVRNCWDKSDENPRLCKCEQTSFVCGDSDICIPYDHVCDGEIDCPGEEDEHYCYALQQNPAETNYGEVMQQSHGIWHSMCFPKDGQYDEQKIKEICHSIGYRKIRKVFGRKMIQESRLRTSNRTHNPVDRMRGAATKAVVLNKFSKVRINGKQTFFMKPSRPLYTLVHWDAEDETRCDRLEINCGD